MSESESIPDPVTATAPEAPPAPDDDPLPPKDRELP